MMTFLYNGGFVDIDDRNKTITFDYENHNNLKLFLAGDMMFSERKLQMMSSMQENGITPRL